MANNYNNSNQQTTASKTTTKQQPTPILKTEISNPEFSFAANKSLAKKSYGNCISTAPNPQSFAASNRSKKSYSLNNIEIFAENRGNRRSLTKKYLNKYFIKVS